MEIIILAEKRMAFLPSNDRYKSPHREAMRLRQLWNYTSLPRRFGDLRQVQSLYKEVKNCPLDQQGSKNILSLIKKGLYYDPKFHAFYELRGDIYFQEGKWSEAIRSYESARSTGKMDRKLTEAQRKTLYNGKLIDSYKRRGDWYLKNGLLLKALADYEQVLSLKQNNVSMSNVEDKLLGILRRLKRHEAFELYWKQFIKAAKPSRASDLLSKRAEYKIELRELATARRLLFRSLELTKNNQKAQELLQIVYNTGHTMAAYTVMWCIHGCYDKALITIQKGQDCDPYNPGYTLLKTIVLRLSGRLVEAENWLEQVSKDFNKFRFSSLHTQSSIMGKLSLEESRKELTRQWYLIRYDLALKYYFNNQFHECAWIIERSNLTKYFLESYIMLGDCFLRVGKTQKALDVYLQCYKKCRDSGEGKLKNNVYLLERVIDLLNRQASAAARTKRFKDCARIAEEILDIFNEEGLQTHCFAMQRARALFSKARGYFQMTTDQENRVCYESAADSLRFARNYDETGLYATLYDDMGMEEIIDRFAPRRNLPQSLRILLQYS